MNSLPMGWRFPLVALAATVGVALCGVAVQATTPNEKEDTKTVTNESTSTTTPKKAKKRVFRPIQPPADFKPAVLHVAEPDYDWGNVLQGEVVEHSFVIENKGGSALVITNVKPSCGCTTVAKPAEPIDPGKSDVVTLRIDTKKFRGKVSKTAAISSNASPAPLKVSLKGSVDPFFEMEPQAPKITVVRGATTDPTTVTLKKTQKTSFTVKDVTTESKIVTAELSQIDDGNYELKLVANAVDAKRKYYYEVINVNLVVQDKPFEMPIRVSVAVKDRIDVQPRSSVYFGRKDTDQLKAADAEPISKSLEIQSLVPDHAFEITSVKNSNAAFETKLDVVEAGKHYRLTVSMSKLPTEETKRTIRDTILLETNDPTVKELKVTALAAVQ